MRRPPLGAHDGLRGEHRVDQGFLDRGSDGQWRLSPKAMRQLGQTALRDVAQQLSGRHGERDTRRAGAAGELTGATRPWAFGDTEPWNVTRTLTNAVLRRAGTGVSDMPLRITVEDVEVSETETRTQAAVALLVDTSFSMVMENRWLPMKRTALALRYVDGLSYGELARIRGISINTVKSQLARGKALLRDELGKRGA